MTVRNAGMSFSLASVGSPAAALLWKLGPDSGGGGMQGGLGPEEEDGVITVMPRTPGSLSLDPCAPSAPLPQSGGAPKLMKISGAETGRDKLEVSPCQSQ